MRTTTFFILTLFFLSCNNGGNVQDMTKKLDQLDKDELEMMVENAKKEIDKENFSTATEILDEAKIYVTDDEDKNLLAETNTYYKDEKSAYDKKKRKERQIRKKRQKNNSSDTYSSGSSNLTRVGVYFVWTSYDGACFSPKYNLNVTSSNYSTWVTNSTDNATIGNDSGVAGNYSFTLSVECDGLSSCSGNFYIDGNTRNYLINIGPYGHISVTYM